MIRVAHHSKTNNDAEMVEAKIDLRIMSLPDQKEINVLEAFGGEGVLWGAVKRRVTDKKINVLSIDQQKSRRVQLKGNNEQFLNSIDLTHYDVIDLDAWGSPLPQLEIIFGRKYKGVVHCTFIQSVMGGINKQLLLEYGYSPEMLKKATVLFTHSGEKKLYNYLARRGITSITGVSKGRKNYFYFFLK